MTEIPATTTIEAIMDKIIELIKAGKITEISYIRDETDLSGLKILNLVGKTNTDLKEAYGPQNLPELQACGDRFDQLETALLHLGQSRISAEDYPSALRFLEYAAGIRSDISTVYTALGDCYAALGQPRKIKNLISTVPSANLMLENKVLDHLNKLLPPELPPEENFTSEDK